MAAQAEPATFDLQKTISSNKLTGFWRRSEGNGNHNELNRILEKLRKSDGALNLKIKNNGKEREMKDNEIVIAFPPSIAVDEELAALFTITLPLRKEIPIN